MGGVNGFVGVYKVGEARERGTEACGVVGTKRQA